MMLLDLLLVLVPHFLVSSIVLYPSFLLGFFQLQAQRNHLFLGLAQWFYFKSGTLGWLEIHLCSFVNKIEWGLQCLHFLIQTFIDRSCCSQILYQRLICIENAVIMLISWRRPRRLGHIEYAVDMVGHLYWSLIHGFLEYLIVLHLLNLLIFINSFRGFVA